MGICQGVAVFLMESWSYHGSIFEMRSKSEEDITEIKDRLPVQNDLDPISNLDENNQCILIGPM